jgi:phosphoserine phosphatase
MSLAFFDVDGTLLPHPSLERRFFWRLVRRAKIPPANYLRWAAQLFRLSATNPATAAQSSKMYLRGVSIGILSGNEARQNRWIPEFFPGAIRRVWWHVLRGDRIVLLTGTLSPLAKMVQAALERELLCRGVETRILALSTRLATRKATWTGCVDGVPLFGEAKSVAAEIFAKVLDVPLAQCYAYGDHALDRWMLESVGNPVAVNPTSDMRRIAQQKGWQVVNWTGHARRTAAQRNALKWKGEVAR